MQRLRYIDSHTGGEPTRLILDGGPDLGSGPLAERRQRFATQFDQYRSAIVNEPRGSDILVGAMLVPPEDAGCLTGVIFFNNVGYLGMCGHGTIGVVMSLVHDRGLGPGGYRIETPVGIVDVEYLGGNEVRFRNVPSYRFARDVAVPVEGHGTVKGDIAYGGNWFFLIGEHDQSVTFERINELLTFTLHVRAALIRNRVTGAGGAEIDHIELFGPAQDANADSKNFVLCPGLAYDRSPCGTGTSAKLACLIDDGILQPGQVWRQESITGSIFEASAEVVDGQVIPTIQGAAYITAEGHLLLDESDPLCYGIRS